MTATLITGARLVGREGAREGRSVLVEDGRIVGVGDRLAAPEQASVVDASGGTLLPGFIESHTHLDGPSSLEDYVRAGVTTVVDMGGRDDTTARALSGDGRPTVLSAGVPATAVRGMHTRTMGFPTTSEVVDVADAARFVRERVAAGADFVKVIVEDPKVPGTTALPPETLSALVAEAHSAGRSAVAHVVTTTAFGLADDAGVDVITHTPLDGAPDERRLRLAAARGVVLVPTLTMMDEAATTISARMMFRVLNLLHVAPRLRYSHAEALVRAYRPLGGTVLVGTDANTEPKVPARPAFGSSYHEELARLAACGMSPTEVLWAGTGAAAEVFGLTDRGVVEEGRRADLVLVDGDPTQDLAAAGRVRSVWIDGRRVAP